MLNRQDIMTFLLSNRTLLERQYNVEKIGIFGSFARDEQQEDSDIDLIVELNKNTPDIYETKQALKTFIGRKFQREIDLANPKYLKSYIKSDILKEVNYVY